jgi:hypothetical protein
MLLSAYLLQTLEVHRYGAFVLVLCCDKLVPISKAFLPNRAEVAIDRLCKPAFAGAPVYRFQDPAVYIDLCPEQFHHGCSLKGNRCVSSPIIARDLNRPLLIRRSSAGDNLGFSSVG